MDFFQFAGYAEIFVTLSMNADGEVPNRLWICLLVGGLCFLIVYIFQTFGLLTIAGREGYGRKWMIFVPFLNVYYMGVCAQKNKVYGMKAQHFAIITAAVEALLVAGYVIYYVSAFTVWDYIRWDPQYLGNDTPVYYYPGAVSGLPAGQEWMGWVFLNLGDVVISWLELVYLVLKLLLLTSFFRTYSARQYVWFSIAGALLPLTGILVYVVRNNRGMNYGEYIKKVRERNYRMYQQQYGNPYNSNPYGGSGGYGGGGAGGYGGAQGGSSAPDPFDGEYGGDGQKQSGDGGSSSGGSPFDEFN